MSNSTKLAAGQNNDDINAALAETKAARAAEVQAAIKLANKWSGKTLYLQT